MSILITIPALYKYTHTHTHTRPLTGLKYHQKRHESLCGSPSPFDPPNPVFVPIIPPPALRLPFFFFSLPPFGCIVVLKSDALGCILHINIGFYDL